MTSTLIPSIAGLIYRIGFAVYILTVNRSSDLVGDVLPLVAFTLLACVPYGVTVLVHITRPQVAAMTAASVLLLDLLALLFLYLNPDDDLAAAMLFTAMPIINAVIVLPVMLIFSGAVLRLVGVDKS